MEQHRPPSSIKDIPPACHAGLRIFAQECRKRPQQEANWKFLVLSYWKFHSEGLYLLGYFQVYDAGYFMSVMQVTCTLCTISPKIWLIRSMGLTSWWYFWMSLSPGRSLSWTIWKFMRRRLILRLLCLISGMGSPLLSLSRALDWRLMRRTPSESWLTIFPLLKNGPAEQRKVTSEVSQRAVESSETAEGKSQQKPTTTCLAPTGRTWIENLTSTPTIT